MIKQSVFVKCHPVLKVLITFFIIIAFVKQNLNYKCFVSHDHIFKIMLNFLQPCVTGKHVYLQVYVSHLLGAKHIDTYRVEKEKKKYPFEKS